MDNNKCMIAGRLKIPDLDGYKSIICLNEDGTLDEDFEIPAMTPMDTFHPYTNFISPLPEDRYLIGGGFSSVNGLPYPGFAVIKSNGTLDVSFDPEDVGKFISAVQQDEGKFVFSTWDFNFPNVYLLRVNEDFTIDPAFNSVTGANYSVSAVQPISGNRILASGGFAFYNGAKTNGLIRVFPDGSLDESFMPEIPFRPYYYSFNALAELPDGRVLVGSNFPSWATHSMICFHSDGSYDKSFNLNNQFHGHIYDIKIQRDGKVLMAGRRFAHSQQHHSRIVRLHPDGSVDESFFKEAGKHFPIHRVHIQPDDKILIGGYFTEYANTPRSRIARLHPDGSPDMGFNPGQGLQPYGDVDKVMVNALGMQQDGKIIAAGDFLMFDSVPVNRIVRLFPDGNLDPSFSTVYGPDKVISDVIVMPDDKILIVGEFTLFDSIPAGRIARLNPNGSLDTTFLPGTGFNNRVKRIALQADGNILAAGSFTAYDGTGRNRLARIKGGEPEGTGRIQAQNGWQVFPNPANERITVQNKHGAEMTGIRIFDLHGRMLKQITDLRSSRIELEMGDIPGGVYILEVRESNRTVRIKILKQ